MKYEYAIDWLDIRIGYLFWYVKEYPQCITAADKLKELHELQQAISKLQEQEEVIAEGKCRPDVDSIGYDGIVSITGKLIQYNESNKGKQVKLIIRSE